MAGRSLVRQVTQIRKSDVYDDTLPPGSTLEDQLRVEGDLNALRSQINRLLHADGAGNWYDDLQLVDGLKRGVDDLNFDLNELETKKLLGRGPQTLLTDITIPASQNWKILSVAGNEAPSLVAAVAADQDGAVCAYSSFSGANFDQHEMVEIAGDTGIDPKNLLSVVSSATGRRLRSADRDVYALLQYEASGVDGGAFDDASGGNRVKLSFVRLTSTRNDLEACPVSDVEGSTVNYSYVRRGEFDVILEAFLLNSEAFVDSGVDVGASSDQLISPPGFYAVSAGVAVRDLVYISGDNAMEAADNSSIATAPVKGIVVAKPTSTTATVLYFGKVDGFAGLSAGQDLFLGTSGGYVTAGSLPTTPGSIIQKIGSAIDSDTILFDPKILVVL